jgi:16S rRNA (cytidine1402-2'-O)-methyltransferase
LFSNTPDMLYIVPTPIGHLKDITLRALDILREVDFIITEDTRTTGKLLQHYQISKPLVSFHLHNEHKVVNDLVERIRPANAALVSDAGTPGISDPGFLLVRACLSAGVEVQTLPGATAFVPALINSGLPCDRFYFHGFLPHKKGRMKELEFLKSIGVTTILYESPHRLLKTLEQIGTVFGPDHAVSVSRELTKLFEETVRGSLSHVIEIFSNKQVKGEFVIVIAPSVK